MVEAFCRFFPVARGRRRVGWAPVVVRGRITIYQPMSSQDGLQVAGLYSEVEDGPPGFEPRFATAQAVVADMRWALCSHVEAFMAFALFVDGIVCGRQGYGKRAAPIVSSTTKVPRVGTAETPYRLPPWTVPAAPSYQGVQAHLGSLLSGVGLGLAEHGGEVARHGRVDNVFDMPCPSQTTRYVSTICTLGLLIVRIFWLILKNKQLDQRRGRILVDAFIPRPTCATGRDRQ